jgi:TolB-like protein/DNA-binding winged helix-turn-helix (wHTH) protein
MQHSLFIVDDLTIDISRRSVTRRGEVISLSPLSFDLFACLASAAPAWLSYDEIISKVWAGSVVSNEAITQRIKVLRDALGDDPQHPRYIQVVRGRGYRMLAPVRTVDEEPGAEQTKESVFGPRRRALALALALLLAAAGVITAAVLSSSWQINHAASKAPAAAKSIAVLPFANLSGDAQYDYFSDGLTEEFINRLTRVPGLRVVARTSSFQFKNRNESVQLIGEKLAVRHLLEGSVRASGRTLRVTAQLVDVSSGYHLWSTTLERPQTDIFEIQDAIALAVVQQLAVTLRDETYAALVRRETLNPDALDSYLRARHYFLSLDRERMHKAIVAYERAIELDPQYTAAYVGLADALMLQMQVAEMGTNLPTVERMEHLLRRAIEADPGNGDAHAVLSQVRMMQYDFEGARRAIEEAERLTPTGSYVLLYKAQYYGFIGWPADEALEPALQGRSLDPLNPWAAIQVPIAYVHMNQYEDALRELDQVLEIEPDFWLAHWSRAIVLDALSRPDEALAAAERAVALNRYIDTLNCLAVAYARLGREHEARAIMAELSSAHPAKYWPPTEKAMILVALRDVDGALAALEEAYRERDWNLPPSLHFHYFEPLYGEPRFERLVKLLGQERRVHRSMIAHREVAVQKAAR